MSRKAVESPDDHLWHIDTGAQVTFCGKPCERWVIVLRSTERGGIWCGVCLAKASGMEVVTA